MIGGLIETVTTHPSEQLYDAFGVATDSRISDNQSACEEYNNYFPTMDLSRNSRQNPQFNERSNFTGESSFDQEYNTGVPATSFVLPLIERTVSTDSGTLLRPMTTVATAPSFRKKKKDSDNFILFVNEVEAPVNGLIHSFMPLGEPPRICGFTEVLRDRVDNGQRMSLRGPSDIFPLINGLQQRYTVQVELPPGEQSPDDLLCFYSYRYDLPFRLDCTQTSHFGPTGPHQRYQFMMRKSMAQSLNYIIVRRDVLPCVRFTLPPELAYVVTSSGDVKKNSIKPYYIITQ